MATPRRAKRSENSPVKRQANNPAKGRANDSANRRAGGDASRAARRTPRGVSDVTLTVAFVPGVMPDKWASIWREREPERLTLWPLSEAEAQQQWQAVSEGAADLVFVRTPPDSPRPEGWHAVPLYLEDPVAVVPKDHPATAYDDLPLTDLADEQLVAGDPPGWAEIRRQPPLEFPPMSTKEAIEVVASGTGFAVLPQSVARLHHRKDVRAVRLSDVPSTRISLAWLVAEDDELRQRFQGVVRGRRANSSR